MSLVDRNASPSSTSLANPRHDFDVIAFGTLNLLEVLCAADERPPLVFTSTNKVYTCLEDIALNSEGGIYYPNDTTLCAKGIDELRPLALDSLMAVPKAPQTSRSSTTLGRSPCMLVQLAVRKGARVIALSRRRSARDVARRCGAVVAIPFDRSEAVAAELREITGDRTCERVIEAAGAQATLDPATVLTGEYGRLIIAEYHQDGPRQVNMQLWNWRAIDVINAHERNTATSTDGMRDAAR